MANTVQDLMIQLGMDTSQLNEKVSGAWDTISGFAEKATGVLEAVGIALGLKELGQEALEAYSKVENLTASLTALLGSAEEAHGVVEQMEALAASTGVADDMLFEAAQRMVAFGFAMEDIPGALQASADAAAAMNSTVDQTSGAIERMAATGNAGSRQLVALGLTTKDLADVMGTTEDQVKQMFLALDQESRLEVLTVALQKFAGQAEAHADTLSGHWQIFKNTFEELFETVGADLSGMAGMLLGFVGDLAKWSKEGIEAVTPFFEYMFRSTAKLMEDTGAVSVWLGDKMVQLGAFLVGGGGPQFIPGTSTALPTGGAESGPKRPLGQAITDQQANDIAIEGMTSRIRSAVQGVNEAWSELLPADRFKPIQDATSQMAILNDELSIVQSSQKKTTQSIAEFGLQARAAGFDISGVNLQIAYFTKQQYDAQSGMQAAQGSIPPLIDDLGGLSQTGERTAESQKKLNQTVQDFNKVMDGMYGAITPPMDALHEGIFQIDQDLAHGNFAQIDQIINRLAKDDLPEAVKQQDRFVAVLEAANAPTSELNNELAKQIQLHAQLGESMNRQVIQLANLDEKQKIMAATTNIWGKAYTGLLEDVNRFGAGLASNLARGIVEGQRFGQIFSNIWKQFAEAILTTVITALEQLALKWIAGLIGMTAAQKAANASQIMGEGGVTFAAAFASVMEAVPFPFNIALAPAVAGTEMATMLGVALPMAAAAQGAYLTEDMVIAAGADELILPPNLSRGLSNMIDTNSRSGGSSDLSAGGAGTPTININGPITGVTKDTTRAVAAEIIREAKLSRAMR